MQSSLRDFVKAMPWMKNGKREARQHFCNDAFEIAWVINKGQYLLSQVETTMRDWTAPNLEKLTQEMLKRKAYPKIMLQELGHLFEV